MRALAGIGVAGALALACTAPALAAESRAEAAARLPDWSGVWRPLQADVLDAPSMAKKATDTPPYTAAYAAKYRAIRATLARDPKTDPLSVCVPLGMPRMMTLAGLYEFAVTPEQVLIFSRTAPNSPRSTGTQVRRIYTDGRPQLAGDDLFPTYTGNSIGRWEGDTLVVTTVGLRDDNFLDRTGAPLSGDQKITERIRLTPAGVLEDRMTIEDPKALTRPWTVTRRYARAAAGVEVVDDSCASKRVNPAALTDAAAAKKPGGAR